jgi:hypothetical protein
MSMFRVCSSLLAAMVLAPALASAQPTSAPAPTPRDQAFTFGDELVQSSLPRPDQATVRGRVRQSGTSLIRHRAHFVPEMLRSVERL